jgi:hypothetical protein
MAAREQVWEVWVSSSSQAMQSLCKACLCKACTLSQLITEIAGRDSLRDQHTREPVSEVHFAPGSHTQRKAA